MIIGDLDFAGGWGLCRLSDSSPPAPPIIRKIQPDAANCSRPTAGDRRADRLLIVMKGLPLAFKDMQMTKQGYDGSVGAPRLASRAMTVMVVDMVPDQRSMKVPPGRGLFPATDLADCDCCERLRCVPRCHQ